MYNIVHWGIECFILLMEKFVLHIIYACTLHIYI